MMGTDKTVNARTVRSTAPNAQIRGEQSNLASAARQHTPQTTDFVYLEKLYPKARICQSRHVQQRTIQQNTGFRFQILLFLCSIFDVI